MSLLFKIGKTSLLEEIVKHTQKINKNKNKKMRLAERETATTNFK